MPATAAKLKAAASSTSEQAESPEPQGSTSAVDVPIASLGEDDDDDDDEGEDDVGEHGGDVSTSVAGSKGKRKAEAVDGDDGEPSDGSEEGDEDATETPTEAEASGAAGGSSTGAHPWQAVWSPEKNAWYFWNTSTGEVTWTNPLEPTPPTGGEANPPLPSEAPPLPAEPAPVATTGRLGPFRPGGAPPDIDPDLAYLLPPESRGASAGAGPSSMGGAGGQTAQFNARTGRFTAADYKYTVDHLDEYNRMKRMNSQYFDQEAWERERAAEAIKRQRDEAQGVASKPQITKKDMERFKKQKLAKKMRSQAWLRD